ncbi:tRNA (adenosine(37)-N6)-dimethylallyltransferase MiaA [Flavobacteriaceae bacterium TP-CH-4]|uniref:tRNA dimethylallyltransferase n=1 Tax=Pelagihabitans pacificus TaxID=2696054 RepID=A0A967AS01_9FLAO|nr:tRNA (adenosine(37)-N6)-dimethylallyltransferase MiaA [Pelagihabitans pacificus]NHF59294.1 tRNA (adenosine(37)-N6)-dimethylallyltransferase MiaA [Pelagihabitans pacificus]
MSKKVLVSIVGPTGIGKTTLAIAVAKYFDTEIVSADSRQFYKEITIGTAVPSVAELHEVPHHFIQHRSILEDYSVGDYERDAMKLLRQLFQTHDIVVLVGGSGLYVDAVTKGLDDFPEIDKSIRLGLNELLQEKGLPVLQRRLKQLDPDYYHKVDLENPHRVIRALEVCIGSGRPYSSFLTEKRPNRFFKNLTVGIQAEREIIYKRIDQRVDAMMRQGLLKEAKALYPQKSLNALQTVGYRELFQYFDGKCDLDFAVSEIKKNTRRFAKRQLTWYRRREDILWVAYNQSFDDVLSKIEEQITAFSDERK